ncbi:hypothetical protein K435DRAFT_680330, partial [Dendrothele bispora CBS 962.96]
MSPCNLPKDPFCFASEEGHKICREIARKCLPYDPHDVSLEAIGHLLDKKDVFVRTACGSGKTGIIALMATVFPHIHQNHNFAPNYRPWYHKDPVFLVVCPTNALELDIVCLLSYHCRNMLIDVQEYKLKSLDINALWSRVKSSRVILLSPELLSSDLLRKQLEFDNPDSPFQEKCAILVIDEAHMVWLWGPQFREAYRLIGTTRVRLNKRVRLLCMTATLRTGGPRQYVLQCFGLRDGNFVDIHRSNLRPEIRVTTSVLKSSLASSFTFPELRWVIGLPGITIIFLPDRNSGLRIALYLRRCNPYLAPRTRKWDALNDEEYDKETMDLVNNLNFNLHGLIIVSTTVLMVGVDFQGVKRIISLEPGDFDQELQMEGRMRESGESYLYVSKKTMESAQRLDAEMEEQKKSMELSWASRLVAPCRSDNQNTQYNNPPYEQSLCRCSSCTEHPRIKPPCLCSGCRP